MKSFEEYLTMQYQKAERTQRDRALRISDRHKTREERKLARRTAAGTAIISIICLLAATLILIFALADGAEEAQVPKMPSPMVSEVAVQQPVLKAIPLSVEPVAEPVVESSCSILEQPTYTEEELEILAIIIYQESGGDACSNDTRLKVGTVFLNRVADPRYPDTFDEVALQYKQYGTLYWTGIVWPDRASRPEEAHAVARAYECAQRLLEGERFFPEDVIFQSEHIQGTEIVCQQDGFYFCR